MHVLKNPMFSIYLVFAFKRFLSLTVIVNSNTKTTFSFIKGVRNGSTGLIKVSLCGPVSVALVYVGSSATRISSL